MSSQFDSLLDFGDEPPPSTNGSAQQANGGDDFDPFGPGPLDSGKGGGGADAGLLLDFSVSTETSSSTTKNGTTASDPFDNQFSLTANADTDINNTSASTNPFADMSSSEAQPSANPLYDLMDEDFSQTGAAEDPPANPLYDLSHSEETIETTTTTMVQEESSANPLYDLMDADQETTLEVSTKMETTATSDLLGMDFGAGGENTTEEKSAPAEDTQAENLMDDQVVPVIVVEQESAPREVADEDQEEENFDQNVELFIREEGEDQAAAAVAGDEGVEPSQDMGAPPQQELMVEEEEQKVEEEEQKVEEEEQKEVESERARSRSRSPSRHSISSEGEVINEEEEMRQDQRAERQAMEDEEERKQQETKSEEQTADAAVGGASYGVEDTHVKEDFHFQEMSSTKAQQQETAKQPTPPPADTRREATPQQWEDEQEEGVYENEPELRSDVARETDRDIGAELPSVGTAKSMRDKFVSGQVENTPKEMKKEATPPAVTDGGVFENEPQYNPDVVHAGDQGNEALPEQGTAKNLAARFKEMEKAGAVPVPSPGKREITPDRTGKVEYVSEPRGHIDKYEPEVQAGIFESQPAEREDVVKSDQLPEEVLPEKGSAKNMAERFKQMSTEKAASTPRGKREITPDTSGRVEFVSEPTGFVEKYEGRTESGVFESQPADREDVVKSDATAEEIMPEQGMARNIAARFKEMEKTTKSPPSPTKVKEFTPPRENGTEPQSSGVYESTPQVASDVVHADDQVEEVLPEKGTARSIADRFRQLSSGDNTPSKSPRSKKEFTPPPDRSGVYENNPKQFVPDYNQPAESGILESKPEMRNDVVRSEDPNSSEQELPERGYTKNLLSAWRQKESESTKVSPPSSGKPKEFTPPREEPRVTQQRPAPRTPKSPQAGTDMNDGSVHPSDLPGQYQPQAEASVFESQPEHREDVVREEDTDWTQGMPKPDTTKKMLAKFKNIQQQANASASSTPTKPKPAARKEEEDRESSPDQVGRSKSMRVAVQLEKCGACQKTVYAMEKIEIEKHSYHKSCFRCSHCHCILTPKTFAINNNIMFCTTHYKQKFATKGNYDEGFGRDQHKKRWKSEPNLADDEHSSSASAQH